MDSRGARGARAAGDPRPSRRRRCDRARCRARARARAVRRQDEVAARQALTAEAVALLDAAEDPPLAGIVDVVPCVERAERDGVLGPGSCARSRRRRASASNARRVVHGRRELAPRLEEIATRIEPSLAALARGDRPLRRGGRLRPPRHRVAEAAQAAHRAPERQRARARRARACRAVGGRARRAAGVVPRRARGRPVLAVRAASRGSVPGIVHDASSSGQTVFVEPLAVVELNNRLAEAAAEAREEAERILRELSARGRGAGARRCARSSRPSAQLDLALACGALSRGWRGAEVEVGDERAAASARGIRCSTAPPRCRSTSSSAACARS